MKLALASDTQLGYQSTVKDANDADADADADEDAEEVSGI